MANHNEVNSEPHTMGRLFKVSWEQDLESTTYQQQEVKKSGVCACGCPPGSKNKCTEVRGYVAGFREQWFLEATSADAEQTNYNSCLNRGNGTTLVCVCVCVCVGMLHVVMWRKRDREKDCVFLRKVWGRVYNLGNVFKVGYGSRLELTTPVVFTNLHVCVCVCVCSCMCVFFLELGGASGSLTKWKGCTEKPLCTLPSQTNIYCNNSF